jgi:uncharacterized protein DUF6894
MAVGAFERAQKARLSNPPRGGDAPIKIIAEHFPAGQLACYPARTAGQNAALFVQSYPGKDIRQEMTSDPPANQAAQREAVAIFSDLAPSFARDIDANPEWQIEVTDEARKPISRLYASGAIFGMSGRPIF